MNYIIPFATEAMMRTFMGRFETLEDDFTPTMRVDEPKEVE